MKKKYLFTLPVFLVLMSLVSYEPLHRKKIAPNENWNVDIGKTTFRTNVSFTPSYLVIGSNGDNYRDANITDNRNGVHIINRRTGQRFRNFADGSIGDLDVNGTLIYNNRIYFGNDNDEFICADLNGNIKYSLPVSGDVESEPVLIKIKGKDALVFGTEAGELRAIDPKNGKTIWQHFHSKFNGWKMGDNRLVFKVKTHFSMTYLFLTKPLVKDLNSDGVGDLVYLMNGDFYSVNGRNGKILHHFDVLEDYDQWDDPSVLHNACYNSESLIFIKNKVGQYSVVIPKFSYRPIPDSYRTDGYQFHLATYDMEGKMIEKRLIEEKVNSNDFVRLSGTNIYSSGDKIFQFDDQMQLTSMTGLEKINKVQDGHFQYFISGQLLEVGQHKCLVFLFQYENLIAFYDIDSGKAIRTYKLQGRSEFVPVVEDVNKDGRLDLLYADDSNYLTCLDLGKDVQILNK